jgi:hypothetical protein
VRALEEGDLGAAAICHCGAGSEAGSGACYVKFGAVRPGVEAADQFERLLDACEAFATASDLDRLVAGVNTGRLNAYRQLLARAVFDSDAQLAGRSRRSPCVPR